MTLIRSKKKAAAANPYAMPYAYARNIPYGIGLPTLIGFDVKKTHSFDSPPTEIDIARANFKLPKGLRTRGPGGRAEPVLPEVPMLERYSTDKSKPAKVKAPFISVASITIAPVRSCLRFREAYPTPVSSHKKRELPSRKKGVEPAPRKSGTEGRKVTIISMLQVPKARIIRALDGVEGKVSLTRKEAA